MWRQIPQRCLKSKKNEKTNVNQKTPKNKQQIKETKTHSKKWKIETQQKTQTTNMEDHDPTENSTEDSIPDSNLYFSWFFPMFSRFPKFFLQNQHFAAKFPFFYMLICWYFFLCGAFVFLLFLFCFFFFWIVFYVQSFCGIVVFLIVFLFFICLFEFGVLWGFFFTTLCGVHWHIVSGFR